MVFGIDIDEVLRGTLQAMVDVYNKEIGDNMKYSDVDSFVVELSFPKIKKVTGVNAGDWFFQLHADDVFLRSKSLQGALKAVKILRKYGTVLLISYQKTPYNKQQAIQWLAMNSFEYDGLCFIKNKSLINVDYLIDDNDWNFLGATCKHGILIDAPYNKDVKLDWLLTQCANTTTLERYSSLLDFSKVIEAKYGTV